jgi:uncharacterized protein (TIGR00255 family)
MIRSMTGYGRGESRGRFGSFKIEIKSVNNKFFDMSSKLPNGLFIFEDRVREYVQKRIKRGRVHVSMNFEDGTRKAKKIVMDTGLASSLLKEIKRFKKANGLKGDVDLNRIITFPGVLSYSDSPLKMHALWKDLKDALDAAIESLDRSRAREGRNLGKDLVYRTKKIKKHIDFIKRRSKVSIRHYKNAFARRIKELSGGVAVDKTRLAQEVAIYAKNCDTTEELTRVRSHLKNFEKSVSAGGEKGKTLDFIAQELMREANTIGAKSSDFQISNHVIKIKSEIEKIREQVKNIE